MTADTNDGTPERSGGRCPGHFLGALIQGIVMGILLFFAVVALIAAAADARVFIYQGF